MRKVFFIIFLWLGLAGYAQKEYYDLAGDHEYHLIEIDNENKEFIYRAFIMNKKTNLFLGYLEMCGIVKENEALVEIFDWFHLVWDGHLLRSPIDMSEHVESYYKEKLLFDLQVDEDTCSLNYKTVDYRERGLFYNISLGSKSYPKLIRTEKEGIQYQYFPEALRQLIEIHAEDIRNLKNVHHTNTRSFYTLAWGVIIPVEKEFTPVPVLNIPGEAYSRQPGCQ